MLMHELGHWTGHPERLDRDMSGVDGTPEYWFEELVAELSVCFVLAVLALPDRMEEFPDSASYLKHYLDLLRDDRRKLVKAASLWRRQRLTSSAEAWCRRKRNSGGSVQPNSDGRRNSNHLATRRLFLNVGDFSSNSDPL